MGHPLVGITVTSEILITGALTGLAYAVLAAGLVLVYRATRVINFAHGEIGAFGAAILAKLVLDLDWNWFLALLVVAVVGAAVGSLVELAIIRRLFEAPRLILLVATIGVAQVMFFAQAVLPGVDNISRFPTGVPWTAEVGGVLLRGEHFMVMLFVPAVIVALALFLNRTSYGMAIRAAAENADAARLAGVNVRRVSTVVWVIAGVLSTVTFVLINPLRGTVVGEASLALGPSLLLRALAVALVGRLVSLPLALVGGLVAGIGEAILFVNVANPGTIDAWLFVAVLVLVLLRGAGLSADDGGTFSLTPRVRQIPERLRQVFWVRHLPRIVGAASVVVALLLPLVFTTSARQFLFARVAIYALIGLSVVVLTGWGGQLSLGQFAFVGLGAMVTFALHARGMPFAVAVLYATVAGVAAALAIGAPALRIRGLSLAIATLAFAVAARGWLLPHDVLSGGDAVVFLPRGSWWFIDLADQRTYYYLCVVVLVLTFAAVSRLRRTGIGRTIIAVRENEHRAAAFTVSPAVAKLAAFAVSGGLAALGGALLAGLRVQFSTTLTFGPEESLRIVAMTIIGGLGSAAGAVLGAIYVLGLPALIDDSPSVRLLTSGVGLLVLLLYIPGGLLQVVHRIRDALLGVAERRLAAAEPERPAAPSWVEPAAPPATPRRPPARVGARRGDNRDTATSESTAGAAESAVDLPAVRAEGITVTFGGLVALRDVTVEAAPGEAVGLIGANGAGKSTLMNVVSGFQRPDAGTVEAFGEDVTLLPPHERARRGLARVFQDARLFGDLTVRESLEVALESQERSELVPSLLALGPSRRAEARKRSDAAELVHFLGLGRFADTHVGSLSTGTRRIAELACLLAMGSRILLLDEPTAGVAQRETEAFGPLLERIRRDLDATLMIIEHDMPLVMSLSDRVYCLSSGEVIAEGDPASVRQDPAVIAAYLGTDERAIARSDAPAMATTGVATALVVDDGDGLESLTRRELIEEGRGRGLTGLSRLRKRELVDLLERR